jgi:hypothetical protein
MLLMMSWIHSAASPDQQSDSLSETVPHFKQFVYSWPVNDFYLAFLDKQPKLLLILSCAYPIKSAIDHLAISHPLLQQCD